MKQVHNRTLTFKRCWSEYRPLMLFGIFRLTKFNSNWRSASAANKSTLRHRATDSLEVLWLVALHKQWNDAHPKQKGPKLGIFIRQSAWWHRSVILTVIVAFWWVTRQVGPYRLLFGRPILPSPSRMADKKLQQRPIEYISSGTVYDDEAAADADLIFVFIGDSRIRQQFINFFQGADVPSVLVIVYTAFFHFVFLIPYNIEMLLTADSRKKTNKQTIKSDCCATHSKIL